MRNAAGLAINKIIACQFATRLAVDDADELWTCRVVMVEITRVRGVQVTPCAIVYLSIAVSIRNLRAVAKYRSLTGADGHLCASVAIEVSNGK